MGVDTSGSRTTLDGPETVSPPCDRPLGVRTSTQDGVFVGVVGRSTTVDERVTDGSGREDTLPYKGEWTREEVESRDLVKESLVPT